MGTYQHKKTNYIEIKDHLKRNIRYLSESQ